MSTRKLGLDRARPEGRRTIEPSPFPARAAGLYSEVVWDRSWAASSRERRAALADADRQVSPAEQTPA
jgi:hypothetical protein